MTNAVVPAFLASILAISLIGLPADIGTADGDYTEFLEAHDRMHPATPRKQVPETVVIRKAFWQQDQRVLLVDARTSREKGELLVLEGFPDSTFVHEFQISADFGAVFELPLEGMEAVPCRVLVRAGRGTTVVDVSNAPGACNSAG